MDIIPYVTGIIATNECGDISNEEGRPILHGTPYELFDRNIFRGYMREFITERKSETVIVTGENNFKQMRSILPFGSLVIVLTSVDVKTYITGTEAPNPYGSVPTGTSLMDIFDFAIRMRRKRIVVLGGRSVYNMFAGHYSHFVHVEAPTDQVQGSKKVHVFEEEDSDCMFSEEKIHLIKHEMKKFIRVPFDDGKLRITILDARIENQK